MATKTTKTNKTSTSISKTMPLKPRMSEKAYNVSLANNTYVFDVPMTANKSTVTSSVIDQFGVEVDDVRLLIVKGKVKTWRQKRGRSKEGRRPDVKKAYVSLSEGHKINIFGEDDAKSKKMTAKDIAKKPSPEQSDTKAKPKGGLKRAFSRAPRQTQSKGGDK